MRVPVWWYVLYFLGGTYLMSDDSAYEHFHLKNKEFTYTVDDSNLDETFKQLFHLSVRREKQILQQMVES